MVIDLNAAIQNLISIVVVFGIFYLIYAQMPENRAKQAIRNLFQKLKVKEGER